MASNSGFEDFFDVPGGDAFTEVTDLFVAGSRGMSAGLVPYAGCLTIVADMEPEEVVLMEGFTLVDAMSAFEVRKSAVFIGITRTHTLTADW